MIAKITIVLALAAALAEAACKGQARLDKMKVCFDECKTELGISDGLAEEIKDGREYPDGEEAKKFALCFYKKNEYINEEGDVTDKCKEEAEKAKGYQGLAEIGEKLITCCTEAKKLKGEEAAVKLACCQKPVMADIKEKFGKN